MSYKKYTIRQIILFLCLIVFSNCGLLFLDPKAGSEKVNPLLALLAFLPTANSSNPSSAVTATYVVSSAPSKDASSVSVSSPITITFVNSIDLNTVTLTNFTVTVGSTTVAGTYNLLSEQFIFTPSSPLNYGTTYTVTIQPSVKYLSGNSVEASYTFQFQTELAPDNTPLSVTGTTPIANDIFIPENQIVQIEFNKQVNPTSVLSNSITAVDGSGNSVAGTTMMVGNVSNKIQFVPTSYYPVYSTITITVSSTLKDLFGNTLGANYTFAFETGETLGPYLVSSTPSTQGWGVSMNSSITLNFNKDLFVPFVDEFSIYLKEDTDETITGTYSVNGSQVVFTPNSPLKKKTRYRMYVTNLVFDNSFNSATPTSFPFTTEVPVQMALGDGFSCYLSSAGKVRCWGFNVVGQLGSGEERFNLLDALQSKEIAFEERALEITAGLSHACARFTSGRMKCWGSNGVGQLGTGNNVDVRDAAKAPFLVLPGKAKKISANGFNTCIILHTEKIACWGNNSLGLDINGDLIPLLGFGYLDSDSKPPTSVNTPMMRQSIEVNDKFKDISVGNNFFCGVLKNDQLRCWGNGSDGQLGLPPSWLNYLGFPTSFIVLGPNPIYDLAYHFSNAYLTDASDSFSLDYGLYDNFNNNIEQILQMATGNTNTCSLKANTKLLCWGHRGNTIIFLDFSGVPAWDSDAAELNRKFDDPSNPYYGRNSEYDFISPIISVSMKFEHVCVVFNTGNVQCWGFNDYYQLGQGGETYYINIFGEIKPKQYRTALLNNAPDPNNHARMPEMYLGEKAIAIETSKDFTCGILESGRIKCWGNNSFGQLGYGNTTTVSDAVNAPFITFP